MPTAATTNTGAPSQTRSRQASQPMATVPFIRASSEHREPTGIDVSRAITTSDQDLGVFDIPAYGYVRSLVILVEVTGGAGAAVAKQDAPWNIIKNIALTEPNGAVINSFDTGHDLYLANKYGGYRGAVGADPKGSPAYSAITTGGVTKFLLRVPIELNLRDGLGALPNQNAAATFKLRATLNAAASVYSTVPTTLPTVRFRVYLEAWDQPESQTAGQTNQVTPPAMNTTQFWSAQQFNVNAGQQTIRLTRLGNYIRNLTFIMRNAAGARITDWPDPATLYLDTRPLDIIEKNNFLNQMYERTGYAAAFEAVRGLDTGVYAYDFTHEFDGTLGQENRDLWLPTLGSTRLELQGNFPTAGTMTVLTNDVAIAGSVFI